MPELTISIEHEVEVYCADCGTGMCSDTEYTQGRTRGVDQFRVTPCWKCIDRAKDEVREEMQEKIDQLQEQLDENS